MIETLDIKQTKTSQSRLAETELKDLPFGKVFTDHMFVADYIDGEWKNFEVMPYGPIAMSPKTCNNKCYRISLKEFWSISIIKSFSNARE